MTLLTYKGYDYALNGLEGKTITLPDPSALTWDSNNAIKIDGFPTSYFTTKLKGGWTPTLRKTMDQYKALCPSIQVGNTVTLDNRTYVAFNDNNAYECWPLDWILQNGGGNRDRLTHYCHAVYFSIEGDEIA